MERGKEGEGFSRGNQRPISSEVRSIRTTRVKEPQYTRLCRDRPDDPLYPSPKPFPQTHDSECRDNVREYPSTPGTPIPVHVP